MVCHYTAPWTRTISCLLLWVNLIPFLTRHSTTGQSKTVLVDSQLFLTSFKGLTFTQKALAYRSDWFQTSLLFIPAISLAFQNIPTSENVNVNRNSKVGLIIFFIAIIYHVKLFLLLQETFAPHWTLKMSVTEETEEVEPVDRFVCIYGKPWATQSSWQNSA